MRAAQETRRVSQPTAHITVVPKNINAISFSPLLFKEILDRHVEVVGYLLKVIDSGHRLIQPSGLPVPRHSPDFSGSFPS